MYEKKRFEQCLFTIGKMKFKYHFGELVMYSYGDVKLGTTEFHQGTIQEQNIPEKYKKSLGDKQYQLSEMLKLYNSKPSPDEIVLE
jgi:hypothetical protein